jgi:TPR repeat protein
LYESAANRGEFLAQIELGRMYASGNMGVQADAALALKWYAAAAGQEERVEECDELEEAKAYLARVGR